MAFPQVAAVNGGFDIGGTDHTVNLPGGINAGDLLLAFMAADAEVPLTWPGDWTLLFHAEHNMALTFDCYYRIADGGEGATITVVSDWAEQTAHTTYRITGYSGTPEAGTYVEGASLNPNPPSLAPTWGAKDTLWFASCGYDRERELTGYPANYTDGRNDFTVASQGCGVGTARRELNASPEDPGTFTQTAGEEWLANTVAIQPEEAPPPGLENKSAGMAAKMIAGKLI